VWIVFRNNAKLGDHKPAVPVRGYRNSANVSEFPEHTMLERWIPSEFVLSLPDNNATFQLTLNGTQYPQLPSSADGWLAITENSLPPGHKLRSDLFRAEYMDQCAVLCARLNAPGAETVRSISGLDTRGVSLTGQLTTQNDSSSGTHQCMIFSVHQLPADRPGPRGRGYHVSPPFREQKYWRIPPTAAATFFPLDTIKADRLQDSPPQ
jgi:hypothetical protein